MRWLQKMGALAVRPDHRKITEPAFPDRFSPVLEAPPSGSFQQSPVRASACAPAWLEWAVAS
jgi:hypothetical protein